MRGGIEPSFAPIGFNSRGELLYSVWGSLSEPVRLQTARIDFASDALASPPENVTDDPHEGTPYPEWSRDGRILGHVTNQVGRGGSFLTLRSVATGSVSVVKPRLRYLQAFSFSPDAQSVIVAGGDFRGRFGLFRIDLSEGEPQLLVRGERLNSVSRPIWSRDGRTLFYARSIPGSRSFVARELATGNEREIARGKLSVSAKPGSTGFEIAGLNMSPDEEYIATVNNLEKPFGIVLISVKDGTTRTMLEAPDAVGVGIKGWAPDSRTFYATKHTGQRTDTLRISIEGGVRPAPGLSAVSNGFFVQPGGSLTAFPKSGGVISPGNVEVWALENILPAIKASR